MKTVFRQEKGFHIIEIVVAVVIVGVVAFIGYRVWLATQTQTTTTSQPEAQTTPEVNVPEIKTAQDLESAEKTLDSLDNTEDAAELTKLEQEISAL